VIEEIGVVVSVRGETAEVQGQRRGACGGCAVNGACGTSLIARYLGRKRLLLRAHNAIGAAPGDRVVFGLPEGALLEASFAAYLVPLLAMIGGGVVGEYIAGLYFPAYVQATSVLGGLAALAAALWWLRRFAGAKSSDDRYRPRILRRVGDERGAVRLSAPGLAREHRLDGR
jgi:sigma-E factor negative regulatory protein RseC